MLHLFKIHKDFILQQLGFQKLEPISLKIEDYDKRSWFMKGDFELKISSDVQWIDAKSRYHQLLYQISGFWFYLNIDQ